MRIKILLVGDDPGSAVADSQLLRERGLLVFTAFNTGNIGELVSEIKPDVVFFDPHRSSNEITDAYNKFVGDINYIHMPVIFTLADDDVYLVTRKRIELKERRTGITDNIIGGIKMALSNSRITHKKAHKIHHPPISFPATNNRA